MSLELLILVLALVFGFYVAWNIGANDVANAVGTAVGSGALKLGQAVIIAAIFEFAGAYFLGSNVAETIESGIVNPDFFENDSYQYIYGMLAALLATGVWLQIATTFGWPVSTTHSIVGAVFGFGLISGHIEAIFWGELFSIGASWLLSPLLGGGLAFLLFSIIRRRVLYKARPLIATKKITPYLVFFMFFVLTLIVLFQGLKNVNVELTFLESFSIALAVGLATASISYLLLRRIELKLPDERKRTLSPELVMELKKAQKYLERVEKGASGEVHAKVEELAKEVKELAKTADLEEGFSSSEYRKVEKVFAYLQIITAAFMAFAHGSNDVANAIGPISAIFNLLEGKSILFESVPRWLLLLGAVGIVTGLATFGWRVIETIGRKITELTPSRGFAAGLAAAVTIVLASKLGLPISTTHVIVGAVLGVGFARGIGALNLDTIREIVISWIVTVPAGAILSVLFFYGFRALFALI